MISVCLATFNGEQFIKDQIRSILIQLSPFDEIIISDDNSTDNTIKILEEFNDVRIKIFFNSEKGYTSNFENAIKNAKGDFIFLSDQDDVWDSSKVKVLTSYLEHYDFIVSDCLVVDANLNVLNDSFYSLRKVKKTFLGNIIKFSFLGCCFAFKSSILKSILPFPRNRIMCTHDNWIFLIASFFYKYKIIDDKLIFYRRHGNNVTTGGEFSNNKYHFKFQYRLYLCVQLFFRGLNIQFKRLVYLFNITRLRF